MNSIVLLASRCVLALFFVVAGTTHLILPAPYLAIMPSYVPWPAAMVAITGVAEILGGLGVCFRPTLSRLFKDEMTVYVSTCCPRSRHVIDPKARGE